MKVPQVAPQDLPPPARHIIAVGSGKGGVGKSTVTLNLALALAEGGARTGILDADVYGPNIPLMVNLARRKPARGWTLAGRARRLEPVEQYGLKIMSSGFIVAENQPLTWSSDLIHALMHQLLYQVVWDGLDYLIVDLPPGTADLQQRFASAMPLKGAVIVVTPQDVAHLDARRAIEMYRAAGVPILGAIENMSGLVCPHCNERVEVFHPVREDRSVWTLGTEKLGQIPLDPNLSRSGDSGHPLFVAYPESPQTESFRRIAGHLTTKLEQAAR